MAYGSNSIRRKNSHKNSYFSDSVKTLHLPFGDTGGMTGQGDPSSWTESTGTTDPLCPCKKRGEAFIPVFSLLERAGHVWVI